MKYLVILISLLMCKCDESTNDTVTFTGFDSSKCGCCWGYEINLENGSKVKCDKFPLNLNLKESTKFPFKGKIEFIESSGCQNHIDITSFEIVK